MTQAKKSTAKKRPAPKRTTAKKTAKRGGKAKVLKLVDFMPEDERLAALKRAAERLDDVEQTQEVLNQIALLPHLRSFTRGVVDSADIAYFVGFAFVFLFLTFRTLESRRWR